MSSMTGESVAPVQLLALSCLEKSDRRLVLLFPAAFLRRSSDELERRGVFAVDELNRDSNDEALVFLRTALSDDRRQFALRDVLASEMLPVLEFIFFKKGVKDD